MLFNVSYTGTGNQTDYTVPTRYIRKSHITAFVNGVIVPYEWLNDTTIRLKTAPPVNSYVLIERKAPVDAPMNEFTGSTIITDEALTEDFNQCLQRTERADYADDAGYAKSAGYATNATNATNADRANSAGYADSAGRANSAGYADSAGRASSAGYADSAGSANTSNRATSAGSADRAGYADRSGWADGAAASLRADGPAQSLSPGRTINGVLFDGTQDITLQVTSAPVAGQATTALTAYSLTPGGTINGVVFRGNGDITISAAPSNEVWKTVFVGPGGSDASSGRNEDRAVASLEKALEIVEGQADSRNWTVCLLGGVKTAGELPVPDYTTIVGKNFQRQNTIQPDSETHRERNVFLCGNRVHLVNLKFNGWKHDNITNPTKGFAMAFRPGAEIFPGGVPYGQNCVVGNAINSVPTPLPNDPMNGNPAQEPGMGCVIADSSVLSGYSVFPNIMTWGFTPNSPNGIGYLVKNRAHINCVNAIGVGAHVHFMAQSGGNMVLSACSSQFGDYALWSEGTTYQAIPLRVPTNVIVKQTGAIAAINSAREAILGVVLPYIASLRSWTNTQTILCTKDMGLILDALGVCIEYGTQDPMINVVDSLFTFTGLPVIPFADLPDCKLSWNKLRDTLLSQIPWPAPTATFITALFERLTATLDNYYFEIGQGPAPSVVEPVKKKLQSLITAIGHQMTAQLTGTQFFRVPPQGRPKSLRRAIIRRNGGRINFSGQDDRGNALFVGGLEINSRTGELGGPPFDAAVFNRAVESAIASSF